MVGIFFTYLGESRHLPKNRPQCFRHGDYSVGNLMITDKNHIAVVDWEADDYDNTGGPWLDFMVGVWVADTSPHFALRLKNGYFDGRPPHAFGERIMLYVFSAILPLIHWTTEAHGEA